MATDYDIKTRQMEIHSKISLQRLERILKENPSLNLSLDFDPAKNSFDPRSDIDKDLFFALGKKLYEDSGGLYFTSHIPRRSSKTAYRLFRESPRITHSGHPDWFHNRDIALLGMFVPSWEPGYGGGLGQDRHIYANIVGDKVIKPETIFTGASFCEESKIYCLKAVPRMGL